MKKTSSPKDEGDGCEEKREGEIKDGDTKIIKKNKHREEDEKEPKDEKDASERHKSKKMKFEQREEQDIERTSPLPSTETESETKKLTCNSCDFEIRTGDKFCTECGSRVQENDNKPLEPIVHDHKVIPYPQFEPQRMILKPAEANLWIHLKYSTNNLDTILSTATISQISEPMSLLLGHNPKNLNNYFVNALLAMKEEVLSEKYQKQMKQFCNVADKCGNLSTIKSVSVLKHVDGDLYGMVFESVVYLHQQNLDGCFGFVKFFWKIENAIEAQQHISSEMEVLRQLDQTLKNNEGKIFK